MSEIDAKKFYNEVMPGKFGDDYEQERWHKNPIQEIGYEQTEKSIHTHLSSQKKIANILELGPGSGTWSRVLCGLYPDTPLTVVDISKEMLDRAHKELGDDNVSYIESRFEEYETDEKYDLFFSSRVIEYMDDKEIFVHKLASVMNSGGRGVIITKMPHYTRLKLQKKTLSSFHSGQIHYKDLLKKLENNGLKVYGIYPVTVTVPLCKSALLNKYVGKVLQSFPINPVSAFFTESYIVIFNTK